MRAQARVITLQSPLDSPASARRGGDGGVSVRPPPPPRIRRRTTVDQVFVEHRQLWLALAGVVVGLVVLRRSNMLRYIPNNRLGIVEKLWSARGSVTSGFIALGGEAGFQSDVLR